MSDEDTGTEGTTPPVNDPPAKTFTQDEVNSIAASERKKAQAEIEELQKARADQDAAIQQRDKEQDELKAALASKEQDALRMRVGIEAGLPMTVIDRLKGDDEDALKADAEGLKELLAKPKKPEGEHQGPKDPPATEEDMSSLIRRKAGRA